MDDDGPNRHVFWNEEGRPDWLKAHLQHDMPTGFLEDYKHEQLTAEAYLGIISGNLEPLRLLLMSPHKGLPPDIREVLVELLTPNNSFGHKLELLKHSGKASTIKNKAKELRDESIAEFIYLAGGLTKNRYEKALGAAQSEFSIGRSTAAQIWREYVLILKETGIYENLCTQSNRRCFKD